MQPKSIDAHDSGFSLLEAVIGMAIVSLTLSAFYGAVNICVEATDKAREEELVVRDASQIFASLGVEYPLTEGVQSIDLPGRRTATLAIRPLAASSPSGAPSRLQLLDVALTLSDLKVAPVTLHTLRIKQMNAQR